MERTERQGGRRGREGGERRGRETGEGGERREGEERGGREEGEERGEGGGRRREERGETGAEFQLNKKSAQALSHETHTDRLNAESESIKLN